MKVIGYFLIFYVTVFFLSMIPEQQMKEIERSNVESQMPVKTDNKSARNTYSEFVDSVRMSHSAIMYN